MKNPVIIPSIRCTPLRLAACVAISLGFNACEQKTTAVDPQKERQLQEMQSKLDALSAQSSELNRQLADREASDAAAKRVQLEREQEKLDQQRADLEAERKYLLASKSADKPTDVRTQSSSENDNGEAVYKGKPATYEVFYSKLQDDGNWIQSDDYGYIWHPAVAERDSHWKPYSDGHWVETDRGWTWESNERFGWATYHYGRWVSLENTGWCWVPGNEWAPAWVSWRTSDRYVGWAPLPPEARVSANDSITASVAVSFDTGPRFFNFVQAEDFGEESYVGRIVEPEQNITIINETVNVTNVTYVDNSVHNYGPDYDVVRGRSRRPVSQYRLELQRNGDFNGDDAAPRVRGDRLAIIAPVIDGGRQSDVRPVKVERKVARVERNNGWRGVDPAQRQAMQASLQRKADSQTQTRQAEQTRQKQQAAWAARKAKAAPTQVPVAPAQPLAAQPKEAIPAQPPASTESIVTPMPTTAPRPTANGAVNEQKARREAWQRRQAAEARQKQQAKENTAQPQQEKTPGLERNEPAGVPGLPTAPVLQPPTPDGAEAVRQQNQAQMERARAVREIAARNEQAATRRAAAQAAASQPKNPPPESRERAQIESQPENSGQQDREKRPEALKTNPAQQGRANRGVEQGDPQQGRRDARQGQSDRGNANAQEKPRRKKQLSDGEATPTPEDPRQNSR